jgi:hypothetical protein
MCASTWVFIGCVASRPGCVVGRRLGLGPQSIVAVAIDEAAGVAQQVQWIQPNHTVAVVNSH